MSLAQTPPETADQNNKTRKKIDSPKAAEDESYFCTRYFRGQSSAVSLDVKSKSLSLEGEARLQIGIFEFAANGLVINYTTDNFNQLLKDIEEPKNNIESLSDISSELKNIRIAGSSLKGAIKIGVYAETATPNSTSSECEAGMVKRSAKTEFFGQADNFEWQKQDEKITLRLIGQLSFNQTESQVSLLGSEVLLELDEKGTAKNILLNNEFTISKDKISVSAGKAKIDLIKKVLVMQDNVLLMFERATIFETKKLNFSFDDKKFIYSEIPNINPFLIR